MKSTKVVITDRLYVPVRVRMEIDYDFSSKESAITQAFVDEDPDVRVRDIYKTLFAENKVKQFDEKARRLATLRQNDMYLRGESDFSGFMPKDRFLELMPRKEKPLSLNYKELCTQLSELCLGAVSFAGGVGGFYMATSTVFSDREFTKATDGILSFEKDKSIYFLTRKENV